MKDGFFAANSLYLPITTTANQEDYTLYVLAIIMESKITPSYGQNSSRNVPVGISSLAQTIENMASK